MDELFFFGLRFRVVFFCFAKARTKHSFIQIRIKVLSDLFFSVKSFSMKKASRRTSRQEAKRVGVGMSILGFI
jgi:hypothetical protein